MQTAVDRPNRPLPTRALAIVGAMVVIVIASQVVTTLTARPLPAPARPAAADPLATDHRRPRSGLDLVRRVGRRRCRSAGVAAAADHRLAHLERIRADVAFWGARAKADPDDFVSSNRLGISRDRTRPDDRRPDRLPRGGRRLRPDPEARPAQRRRPRVPGQRPRLAAPVHRRRGPWPWPCSRGRPDDPVALATLGDASSSSATSMPPPTPSIGSRRVNPSAATEGRLAHLAFIRGDTATAVRARQALTDLEERGCRGRTRRVLPVPARRRPDLDRAIGRRARRRTRPRSRRIRIRSSRTRGWLAWPPPMATSTRPSRRSAPRSRSCRSPNSSPGAATSTPSGPAGRLEARGRRRRDRRGHRQAGR